MIRNLALSFGIRLSTSEPRPFLLSEGEGCVGFMVWTQKSSNKLKGDDGNLEQVKFPCVIFNVFPQYMIR